ncbi:MAG: hypothetical protein ACK4VW_00910 [Anaerolineales bacterium]
MKRYQVLLDPAQHRRLEEIARREQRSTASVLRQVLDVGLSALEGRERLWEQRMQVLERARSRLERMPEYSGDLIGKARAERERERERVWRGGS